MTRSILIALLSFIMISACKQNNVSNGTSSNKTKTISQTSTLVKGEVIIGHEVETITPEGSDKTYWIVDTTQKLYRLYDSLTKDAIEPYMPIYAELKIVDKGKATEGFAEQYDGVYEVVEIIATRKLETNNMTKEEFVDPDGQILTVIYNTDTTIPRVIISYKNNKDSVLQQTEAWAKGAEYKNTTMSWITTSQGGELSINGKKIIFKSRDNSSVK